MWCSIAWDKDARKWLNKKNVFPGVSNFTIIYWVQTKSTSLEFILFFCLCWFLTGIAGVSCIGRCFCFVPRRNCVCVTRVEMKDSLVGRKKHHPVQDEVDEKTMWKKQTKTEPGYHYLYLLIAWKIHMLCLFRLYASKTLAIHFGYLNVNIWSERQHNLTQPQKQAWKVEAFWTWNFVPTLQGGTKKTSSNYRSCFTRAWKKDTWAPIILIFFFFRYCGLPGADCSSIYSGV